MACYSSNCRGQHERHPEPVSDRTCGPADQEHGLVSPAAAVRRSAAPRAAIDARRPRQNLVVVAQQNESATPLAELCLGTVAVIRRWPALRRALELLFTGPARTPAERGPNGTILASRRSDAPDSEGKGESLEPLHRSVMTRPGVIELARPQQLDVNQMLAQATPVQLAYLLASMLAWMSSGAGDPEAESPESRANDSRLAQSRNAVLSAQPVPASSSGMNKEHRDYWLR